MYMAPEILGERKYGTSADLWSCGIIFLEMISDYMEPSERKNYFKKFAEGKVDLEKL